MERKPNELSKKTVHVLTLLTSRVLRYGTVILGTLFREIRNGAKFVEKIKTPYDEPLLRYTKLGGRKQALLDLQATKPTFVEKQVSII